MMKRVLVVVAMVLTAFGASTPTAFAEVQVLTVHLAPSGDPDGSGVAVVRLDSERDLVCYSAVVRNISAPTEPAPGVGSAHIHGPLPATVIAIDLDSVFMAAGTSTFIAMDCVSADSATIDAVLANPELFYFNVHNAEYPAGAVQGSLG
jgi:hypothetical protein